MIRDFIMLGQTFSRKIRDSQILWLSRCIIWWNKESGWRKWIMREKKMHHLPGKPWRIYRSSGWSTSRFLRLLWRSPRLLWFFNCWVLFRTIKAKNANELRELGAQSKVLMLNCDIQASRKNRYWGFEVFAEVKEEWPIAKSISNIITILVG